MGVNVTTPVYEGPFDLLLDLILREEVELYEVSLLTIVDAYLEELENMQEYDLESQLREMSQQASLSWPRRAGLEDAFLSLTPDLLEGVTKEDLREACLRAMAPRPSTAVNTEHIAPIKATVVEAVKELLEDVPKTGLISFRELTKGLTDRIEIVVKFLAILELYKQGVLEIDQIDSFGEISVSWCPGAELSDMDLLDIYEG